MSEIDNPLERIDELTAERDRFGDRIDDLAAEVIRLRADVDARILFGAELIDSNARLRAEYDSLLNSFMAQGSHCLDLKSVNDELVAANTRLVGLVEGARRIIDFTMSYIPAAFVDWHDVCRKWMEESK